MRGNAMRPQAARTGCLVGGEARDHAPPSARAVAARVLHRVETQGAYANFALAAALRRSPLERRERALAEELVYGVLRHRATLDWLLAPCSRRSLESLDAWVRILLRLGAYQLRYLTAVPEYAAVSDTVSLARAMGRRWAAGYVNAVLRELLRRHDPPLPSLHEDAVTHLSVTASHPAWLVRRWVRQWSVEEAVSLCAANNCVPPLSVRVNTLRWTTAEVAALIEKAGCRVASGTLHPDALRLAAPGDMRELTAFREGAFFIQDESSMAAVELLGLRPGQQVLDACAGRGGKTASIAMGLRGQGRITCWDVHAGKLRQLGDECLRLGVTIARRHLADARRPPLRGRPFDAALVDAPCSGLGVVRRYPDLRWRRAEEDIVRLAALQLELLEQVANLVAPGGTLVYAVCSTEPEETVQVAETFARQRRDVAPVDAASRLTTMRRHDLLRNGALVTVPHLHDSDGFFAAVFEVQG